LIAWLGLAATMAAASYVVLDTGEGLTFFRDEWFFVLYRDGHNLLNFLDGHGGHCVVWLVVLFLLMFKAIGLAHYAWYSAAALIFHLAVVLIVYLIARQCIGDLAALGPAIVIAFLGSSSMAILRPFQISFTATIVFGLLALMALDHDDLKGDVAACALLLLDVGWSALTISFIAAAGVGLLVRGRLRSRWAGRRHRPVDAQVQPRAAGGELYGQPCPHSRVLPRDRGDGISGHPPP
jgi:hypothetical protein